MYGYDASGIAQEEGLNARIAEMQAAILRIKLRVFPDWLSRRLKIADIYNETIENPLTAKPSCLPDCRPSYHQYVIRCQERAALTTWLQTHEIGFGIHYPTPVHLMPAYAFLGGPSLDLPQSVQAASEIISLPIHEALSPEEGLYIADTLNRFS